MAQANPPPHIQLPQSVLAKPDLARLFEQINFDMFLLWKKLGGGEDFVQNSTQESYEFDSLFKYNLKSELQISTQGTDYTTFTSETIICTNAITITLNTEPEDAELVRIKITNSDVIIQSSKLIDNQPAITFIFKNIQGQAMIDIFYSLDNDTWYII